MPFPNRPEEENGAGCNARGNLIPLNRKNFALLQSAAGQIVEMVRHFRLARVVHFHFNHEFYVYEGGGDVINDFRNGFSNNGM